LAIAWRGAERLRAFGREGDAEQAAELMESLRAWVDARHLALQEVDKRELDEFMQWPAAISDPPPNRMSMNWEAIGAVGEIAGSGVVVITLAYLAAQFRESR
jgi:hypothetical protein